MKKEILLKTKKDLVQKELQYTGLYMTDEEIQCFSVNQLKILCKIMKQNQKMEYDRSAFLAISTTEALCKENGKIIDFEEVREMSRDEVMRSAGRSILEAYEKRQ